MPGSGSWARRRFATEGERAGQAGIAASPGVVDDALTHKAQEVIPEQGRRERHMVTA